MFRLVKLISVVVVSVLAASAAMAIPVSYSGVVICDSVEASPGSQIVMNVRLTNNDQAISGIEIPLKYSNPYLTIDSVSFVGTLKPAETSGGAQINETERTVLIYYIPSIQTPIPTFSAPSGILAKIYFSIDPVAPEGHLPIDSINIDSIISSGPPEVHHWIRIRFSNTLGTYFYLPAWVPGDILVSGSLSADDNPEPGLPGDFQLSQNYPNPFNPSTIIEFALPQSSQVKLAVFNVLGQTVTVLTDRQMPAGVHRVEFDGTDQPSGIYFYRLSYGKESLTRKMILVK
ncbi:MAG: T9SS type A sorting domain-containing protein [candidate division Zixibacteria bacterium]|nr:T9SS type A sorting domain-containing protein [candidate division Zixibacteria bacterium]